MATPQADRVELAYDLTFTMPFHCGTGLRSGILDRTVVRDRHNYLYIPASTQKGVLREKCEMLERLYTGRKDLVDTPHDLKKALWGLGGNITMSARIFGSNQHPGHLFFEDARMTAEEQEAFDGNREKGRYSNLQTTSYTQVRLERSTRISVKGALYTSEFGLRNFLFKGNVTGWLNCTPVTDVTPGEPSYSLLLLLAGLHLVERLGGNKSTGKETCTCEITSLKFRDKEIKKADWQGWLEHLEVLELYDYKIQEDKE
jgi:CRISPR/Cas system CMR subunit Cmr4 (Cas7 group RAMP superfamily)